jgi:hypothetical protein
MGWDTGRGIKKGWDKERIGKRKVRIKKRWDGIKDGE